MFTIYGSGLLEALRAIPGVRTICFADDTTLVLDAADDDTLCRLVDAATATVDEQPPVRHLSKVCARSASTSDWRARSSW